MVVVVTVMVVMKVFMPRVARERVGSSCTREVGDDPVKAASFAFLVVENAVASIKQLSFPP